jgi:hypothetical protein
MTIWHVDDRGAVDGFGDGMPRVVDRPRVMMMVGGMPMPRRISAGVERSYARGERERPGRSRRSSSSLVVSELGVGLVARQFGHRFLGAVIVNQRLAASGCGDESGGGGVVERPRQAQAGLVEAGNSVISEQRIGATDQSQVMMQVLRRFTKIHRVDLVARCNALIQGCVMSNST